MEEIDKIKKLKKTKALWYLKNRDRLLEKSREYYRQKKVNNNVKLTIKQITLNFD
jgi:hypothetical protein